MNINIPVYVEGHPSREGPTEYQARPLFFAQPAVRGDRLDRLLSKLARELSQRLNVLGRQARHDELAAYTFDPRLQQQRLDLMLTLRRRTARCRFLFVVFRHLGRRIAFTPSIPDVWFDLARNELLADRATEVLTAHFRALEREDETNEVKPDAQALQGTAYVTSLEVAARIAAVPPSKQEIKFLSLGDETPVHGAEELRRVGRCLYWLYPDDLDRAVLRDLELLELSRLLEGEDQRPVLLVGPRQVGKTALVHEYVWRRVSQRSSAFTDRENTWLLAPARLISGMSYVGQWENRLLAILKEARRRKHILYFEDLLGLFLAGQSASSSLSIADVLKPYLERRSVRVLGEITPEALRVLRERDRGFADLFHLLPLREPSEEQTLRVLIHVQRQLESRHRCRFELDVLPVVHDLQRRYARGLAFPGKAAGFLRQLAVKFQGKGIRREDALGEFHLRSGLGVDFLDRRARLARADVLAALSGQVVGQEAALEAAADAIAVAKARLNDPGRPLGVFLFVGPTGVGKTECAKAVTRYLFEDADRLLRFDLNEYGEPGAAARLVGTFAQPEGLLTSAIRRQPFAVMLFDEVEKADPEVFDVLLQVLGEGRLTDALGRTADFSNALIVMTSNLGVREAEASFGLRQDEPDRAAAFVRAAERYFRPEFFNRIDRVIPFRRLAREEIRRVASKVLAEVLGREGLVQRKCMLVVEPAALERMVEAGYDPVLGARALKRSVERHLVQPVGERLAALPPGTFTIIHVYAGPETLAVEVRVLQQVDPVASPGGEVDGEDVPRRVRAAVRRIEEEFAALRPAEPITLGQVRPEHYRYFALRQLAERVRQRSVEVGEVLERIKQSAVGLPTLRRPDTPRCRSKQWIDIMGRRLLREIASALDINEYLRELMDSARAPTGGAVAEMLRDLRHEAALLQLVADGLRRDDPQRVLLWPLGLDGRQWDFGVVLLARYRGALHRLELDVEETPLDRDGEKFGGHSLTVSGPHAWPLLKLEAGVHLHCPAHGAVEPVVVVVLPLAEGDDPVVAARAWQRKRQCWAEAVARGEAAVGDDPLQPGAVIRLYGPRGMVDLRTGLTGDDDTGQLLYSCLTAPLPAPVEIAARS